MVVGCLLPLKKERICKDDTETLISFILYFYGNIKEIDFREICMGEIQKFINILFTTCILMLIMLLILPSELAIADGSKGASYLYEFGGPMRWLTVSNDIDNKSNFIDAVFKGNTGITIHLLAMLYSFFMIFIGGYLVSFVIKKLGCFSK